MHQPIEIIPPRELSEKERRILLHLLSAQFQGVEALRLQAARVKVVEECKDCSTLGLKVFDSDNLKADVNWRVPVEAEGPDMDGVNIHILLHVVDGLMNELEIFREDLAKITQLPEPEHLEIMTLD